MGILDDQSLIEKYDKDGMLGKIQEFPGQVEVAWSQVTNFIIPTHYIKAKKIVVIGMGGSAIGGDLIKDLTYFTSRIPVSVVRGYELPNYVDSDTLVIGSSYSGNTEETLSAFKEAIDRGAKMLAITTGGQMASLCRKYKIPMFEVKYSSQPRAAIAYSLVPLLGIFSKLGYIELEKDEVIDAVRYLMEFKQKIDVGTLTNQNEAKKLAEKLHNKLISVYAGGNLTNVARRFKDQINENSKTTACFDEMPELCHNQVVGFDHPKQFLKDSVIITLESKFDHERNKLRYQVINQILDKKRIEHEAVFINQPGNRFSEIIHNILFADYVSFYLAMLNEVDPTPVEVIKFLKDKLAQNQ